MIEPHDISVYEYMAMARENPHYALKDQVRLIAKLLELILTLQYTNNKRNTAKNDGDMYEHNRCLDKMRRVFDEIMQAKYLTHEAFPQFCSSALYRMMSFDRKNR